jgi:hypothetical protein
MMIWIWGAWAWGGRRCECLCAGERRARRIGGGGWRGLSGRRWSVEILRLGRVQCAVRGCAVGLKDGCSAQMFPGKWLCVSSFIDGGKRRGVFTMLKEGRQASVKSRWRRCGHAAAMERRTEPLSYPCSSLNAIVSEVSAGSRPSAAPTLICELSRRIIASGTRSVLSDAREGRTCACTSAPLNVDTLASASSCRSERTEGAATLGAWLWRWSDSRLRCASRKVRKGLPRAGFSPACQSSTTSPIRRERRFGQRPRRRPCASTGAWGECPSMARSSRFGQRLMSISQRR